MHGFWETRFSVVFCTRVGGILLHALVKLFRRAFLHHRELRSCGLDCWHIPEMSRVALMATCQGQCFGT